ncbi:MAG: VanZ family protein [Chitinophagaceae bacterium]|jgi:VanZ family protein|nr:VanZ family protein [Chitinophagaceae bacterium]
MPTTVPARPSANAYLLAAIAVLLLSFYLFFTPGDRLPVITWLDAIYFDKWVHAGLFLLLVWLWCRALAKGHWHYRVVSLLTVLAIGYGIAVEYIQEAWVPYRSFDVLDMIADGVGALLGAVLYRRWR